MNGNFRRKIVKKVVTYIRRSLEADKVQDRSFDDDMFSYPRLNALYMQLLKKHELNAKDNYLWGALQASFLATQIGVNRISLIEFGVAGGLGLLALEKIALVLEKEFGIGIDVYGFDTGSGLPQPVDYRDMPQLFSKGDFPMDFDRLASRLSKAKLILGLVKEKLTEFVDSKPAPIAFISFDLDLWSSTRDALMIFDADVVRFLPRVYCYFDDIMGASCSEFAGERLAISDFNSLHERRKIGPICGLKYFLPQAKSMCVWSEMFYLAHLFDHDLYGKDEGWVLRKSLDIN